MFHQITKLWRAKEPSDEQMHWNVALRILQRIDPRLVMTKLSRKQRMAAWFRFRLAGWGYRDPFDAWLNQHKRNATEVSAGVEVPLKEKQGEDRAFEIQVRVLEYAIQLRKTIYGHRPLPLNALPQDQESEMVRARTGNRSTRRGSGLDGVGATVRDFIANIQQDTIPSEAQTDIVADFWNKLAFIAWEKSKLESESAGGPWLTQARKYINIVLKVRPGWTPAQLNLARILAAEGKKQQALDTLVKVVGKVKPKPQSPAVPPVSNADAISNLILKMAVERDSAAVANLIQRSYGALSQDTVSKITQALAGKVDSALLSEIISKLPATLGPAASA
jgi:hypothetical protein